MVTSGIASNRTITLCFSAWDATVTKRLTLRSAWIQTDDGHESMWSLGFISPLSRDSLVESWATFPTAPGADTNYTVKVDYVIRLR